MSQPPVQIPERISRSADFKSYFSSSIFAGLNPGEAHITFYFTRQIPHTIIGQQGGMRVGELEHELQCEVRMSPASLKAMVQFLQTRITRLEEQIGEIALAPRGAGNEEPPAHIG